MLTEELSDDPDELRAEVARLGELIGPSEKSYVQLQVDLLGARDAAIGAEAELGTVRGYNLALEAEVVRLQRDFHWFREQFVMKARRVRAKSPAVGKAISRLSSR
jgi:hypothetical protein